MTQKTADKNTLNKPRMSSREKTVRLAKMGMLVAVSIVLVYFIHFPIFPAVAFLEYDPADIPILIGTFAFGPLAGVILTVVTSVVQGVTVSAASGLYGIIMHIIATSVLVLVAGIIYKYNRSCYSFIVRCCSHDSSYDRRKYDNNTDFHGSSPRCSLGSHAVYCRL